MNEPAEGDVRDLPIDPQIVSQQAKSTIKSVVDAIVELVTNSDDSYKRIELERLETEGDIAVTVTRERGGACRALEVSDHAEGMDWEALNKAITFAASASGFFQGKTVRGLFGRGLKEAIVGLGRGRVATVRNHEESEVEIFLESGLPKYRVLKRSRETPLPSGTTVSIDVEPNRSDCPTFDVLFRQVREHFALRDIVTSDDRQVTLKLLDGLRINSRPVGFESPGGELRVREVVSVESLGDAVVEIWEAAEKLDFTSGSPSSLAGVLIKTSGAILDNSLFGYEADEAAHYFFGHVDCPGIAQAVRAGDLGVLTPNRSGLDWRDKRCRSLNQLVRSLLRPLVLEKRKRLEAGGSDRGVREQYRRVLTDLCRLLNSLAEEELEDLPDWGVDGHRIDSLLVRPRVGYADAGEPRTFSIYMPTSFARHGRLQVRLQGIQGRVELLDAQVDMHPHQTIEDVLAGRLAVVGSSYGDTAEIVAQIGEYWDEATFRVQASRKTRRRRIQGLTRGLFRDIDFDDRTPDPIQRVALINGVIRVFLKFPPLGGYLKAGGEGLETPKGSVMLAELVAEAFCRHVARERLLKGVILAAEGGEVDAFNSEVNNLMRKYVGAIHQALVVN